MYQNIFETLAIETTLTLRQAGSSKKWQEIGCFFIQNYLEQLSKTENFMIGHIKAIIELGEDRFIRLSSVDLNKPVNCELNGADRESCKGHLTFNAIVSGIDKKKNLRNFHLALARTCSVYEMLTDYRESNQPEEATHHTCGEDVCQVCHGNHEHDGTCEH
ncbi:hypothetical protein [Acetobacterium wieringae]|uniref:hypothetical protein n=1 Tax=Acetobacterium wieringae TaxID=52694 RepID=UPI0026EB4360|nr:hypothetical protein [Acetobacterium wieringae]